jgi:Exopolysaccharide synthesis, ExoD
LHTEPINRAVDLRAAAHTPHSNSLSAVPQGAGSRQRTFSGCSRCEQWWIDSLPAVCYPILFTQRLASIHFETRRLATLIYRAVPVLTYLERFIRPRWPTPFEAINRVVGTVVLLLGLSMLAPISFSNVAPAILVILIASTYLEEDGALLCVTLGAALLMLAALAATVWQIVYLSYAMPRLF